MHSLNQGSTREFQWQLYKQLELMSESVPSSFNQSNHLAVGLNALWKRLLALLMEELVTEQRIEYLDRCWLLDESGRGEHVSSPLRQFWELIN